MASKDGHTAAGAASPARIHRRRVEFPSRQKGVTLVGELVWPEERERTDRSSTSTTASSTTTTSPSPVAVLQHGLADDRDGFVLPRIAEALATRASCASLRFDFRGNGESGGEFRFGNAATGDVDDVEDAVSFLLGEEERRFAVVALVGHSKAGSTVVAYASRRKGNEKKGDPLFVPLVISVAARFDHADPEAISSRFGGDIFERIKEPPPPSFAWRMGTGKKLVEWELTPEDLDDRMVRTDMGALCSRIPQGTTMLFVHGDDDATVPPSAAARFAEAASGARVVMIEGADHNFTRQEKADELIDVIVSAVKGELSRLNQRT